MNDVQALQAMLNRMTLQHRNAQIISHAQRAYQAAVKREENKKVAASGGGTRERARRQRQIARQCPPPISAG